MPRRQIRRFQVSAYTSNRKTLAKRGISEDLHFQQIFNFILPSFFFSLHSLVIQTSDSALDFLFNCSLIFIKYEFGKPEKIVYEINSGQKAISLTFFFAELISLCKSRIKNLVFFYHSKISKLVDFSRVCLDFISIGNWMTIH